jgi:hypothetical protein
MAEECRLNIRDCSGIVYTGKLRRMTDISSEKCERNFAIIYQHLSVEEQSQCRLYISTYNGKGLKETYLYSDMNEFKVGNQPKTNMIKDKNCNLLAISHII